MRVYKVGGSVRDRIIGRRSIDNDHVVVGATPEMMLRQGYRKVGADFPVFIHPETNEEYALARTERKKGSGYKGFKVSACADVTLEEDLLRRDFTINAMAEDGDGAVIDPYGGRRDISLRVLRHVSESFAEDPLRVLRGARMAAELGFAIADETMGLMRKIVDSGELGHLVAERIWQEFARGLSSQSPRRMLEVLRGCGALAVILPEVEALFGDSGAQGGKAQCTGRRTLKMVEVAALNWCPLHVRLAALFYGLGKEGEMSVQAGDEERADKIAARICERLKVPRRIASFATGTTRERGVVDGLDKLGAEGIVDFFGRVNAWRDATLLPMLLLVADCDHCARTGRGAHEAHPNRALAMACYRAASNAKVADAARSSRDPAAAVRKIRAQEVGRVLSAR